MIETKIYQQKIGKMNEEDRLQLASLLVKAGYTVRIGKENIEGKTTTRYYIAFKGDEQNGKF